MPDRKMMELCRQISAEKDPGKLLSLVEQLTRLLTEEQDGIKAKIRANIGRSVGSSD